MSLVENVDHFLSCHERWIKRGLRINQVPKSADWEDQQCMNCKYFVPLVGAFGEDYGVCSNEQSIADGTVRFEHDGCDKFVQGEWWSNGAG